MVRFLCLCRSSSYDRHLLAQEFEIKGGGGLPREPTGKLFKL